MSSSHTAGRDHESVSREEIRLELAQRIACIRRRRRGLPERLLRLCPPEERLAYPRG